LAGQTELIPIYVDAVLSECQECSGASFSTLYLGGGTPSLLGAKNLKYLIHGLRQSLDLSELVEATIEVNPESATVELLEAAKETGINRVSVGVQSLSDYELKSVGRIHCAGQAIEALRRAKNLAFKTVSADLIIGLPGQQWEQLRTGLETLTGLGIEHLSLYCLSLEDSTPIATRPPGDLPTDDMQAELFSQASAFLENRGYIHYEISNFALSGHECLHNLNYWRGGEYVGFGPAAASHLNGIRFNNSHDLMAYLRNPTGLIENSEKLTIREKAAEEAMLRLRLLKEGLNIGNLAKKSGQENIEDLVNRLSDMVKTGALIYDGASYRLTPSRVLISNPIFAKVLCS